MKTLKDDWAWVEIGFVDWQTAVNTRMFDVYAITIDDSGIDDEYLMTHWRMKQSPYEFIEWYGIKYDLTPRSEIEWGGLSSIL